MADQGLEGSQPVDQKIVPTITTVVSTVDLCCKLDLKVIHLQSRNAEYNPQRYPAVIVRIQAPKSTAFIFASAKMVVTAKSQQQSKLAAIKYVTMIRKTGFPAKLKDFKIRDIHGTCDVKFLIRLKDLANSHGAFSSYGPQMVSGQLICQMKQPNIRLYISESGNIVLTGATATDEIYTAFENIYPVLTEFRKNQQCYGCSSISATLFN